MLQFAAVHHGIRFVVDVHEDLTRADADNGAIPNVAGAKFGDAKLLRQQRLHRVFLRCSLG